MAEKEAFSPQSFSRPTYLKKVIQEMIVTDDLSFPRGERDWNAHSVNLRLSRWEEVPSEYILEGFNIHPDIQVRHR